MSLSRLTEALQMAQWLPQQKQFFEKWQNYVLPTTIVGSDSITVTHDEATGTLTLTAGADATTQVLQYQIGDMTTSLTTGANKATWRLPYAFTIDEVRSALRTASDTGPVTADVNIGGASIFGAAKLSIDQDEKTSVSASTPADFTADTFDDNAEIVFDIDAAGANANGLTIYLIGRRFTEASYYLTETADFFISESGDYLILES